MKQGMSRWVITSAMILFAPCISAAAVTAEQLLEKLQANADQIGVIDITVERTAQTTGIGTQAITARQRFIFDPQNKQVTIKFLAPPEVADLEWFADAGTDVFITRTPQGQTLSKLSDVADRDFNPLAQYCPPPVEIYYPRLMLGGFNLEVVANTTVDGREASVVRGYIPGQIGASYIELVIENSRGLLREVRNVLSSGTAYSRVTIGNYQDYGGVLIPLSLSEEVNAQMNKVTASYEHRNITITKRRGLVRAQTVASPRGNERGISRAVKRASPMAGGEGVKP